MSTQKTAKRSPIWKWLDAVGLPLDALALLAGFCFIGLSAFNVSLTGDQKVHLSEAVEMWTHGEWLYPTLFGEHSYYKPPAVHWLLLGSWNLFGLSFGAAIFPFALLLFFSAIGLAQIAGSPLAALFLVGNVASLMFGFTTQMEVLLLACVVGVAWSVQRDRLWLAWTVAGFAAIAKSPTYAVLFGSSIVAYVGLTQGWRAVLRRGFLLGGLWALVFGLSWYAWVAYWDHAAFMNQFVTREHLSKLHGNGITFFHMTREFALLCVPVFFLLAPAFYRPERLAWVLAAPLFAFLLWTPYRMDAYLYPLLPLLVWQSLRHLPRFPRFLRAQGILIASAVIALLPILYSSRIIGMTALVGLAAFALLYAWGSHPQRLHTLAWATVLLIFTVRVSAQRLGEQDVAGLRALGQKNPQADWRMYDGTHNIWSEVGYLSTAIGRPITRVFDTDSAVQALRAGSWIILDNFAAQDVLPQIQKKTSVQLREWKRWKRGLYQLPLSQMLSFQQAPLREWEEKNQKIFWILTKD